MSPVLPTTGPFDEAGDPLDGGLYTDPQILAARGPKNPVDVFRPYQVITESEYTAEGRVEDVLTVFLSNRECPFRCLMCDLWQNTTDASVPPGAIPKQIQFALQTAGTSRHIKLYNSGNFFDAKAIPTADFPRIAELLHNFRTVIVENHPRLCTDQCVRFQKMIAGQFEVAMGLESSNKSVLAQLNKQMTTDDFARACEFLTSHSIRIRTFILLRPPGVTESEGIEQAIESVRFAFECGVECCAVIPTRAGNGMMDQLQAMGRFHPPSLTSLERVLDETIDRYHGRVFGDLWDARQFSNCPSCVEQRLSRLRTMNLTQTVPPAIRCSECSTSRSPDSRHV